MVNGLPQTVFIGKDGTVKKVQIGVHANLEDQLRKQLDALLDEKETE